MFLCTKQQKRGKAMNQFCNEVEQKITIMEIVKEWIQKRLNQFDDIPFENANDVKNNSEINELKAFVEKFCSLEGKDKLDRLIFEHSQLEATF